jgi:hypothetical protein
MRRTLFLITVIAPQLTGRDHRLDRGEHERADGKRDARREVARPPTGSVARSHLVSGHSPEQLEGTSL